MQSEDVPQRIFVSRASFGKGASVEVSTNAELREWEMMLAFLSARDVGKLPPRDELDGELRRVLLTLSYLQEWSRQRAEVKKIVLHSLLLGVSAEFVTEGLGPQGCPSCGKPALVSCADCELFRFCSQTCLEASYHLHPCEVAQEYRETLHL